jgi:hypothetical protein
MSEKERIARELDQFLLIRGIHWNLLPQEDLLRLHDAFEKLRVDIEEIFRLLDEASTLIPDKGGWRGYTV